ncbi:MAG: hypothetical protein F6K28_37815 [Microcoleus sp. SIO2G3]|nr:hypothetical protein [Microcoleus sp. SIO2G3]
MTEDQPSRLDRIEALLADVAEVVLQNADVTARHDEALTRIETALERLTDRVDNLTSVTAINSQRIEQILEYLFRERPNGRGDAGQ